MSILDKLMEKKDLKTYIEFRMKFLEQEREAEILKQPESERGFVQERFYGRMLELQKLKDVLEKDLIKHDAKLYYKKINKRIKI
jgi:hypothetical protein